MDKATLTFQITTVGVDWQKVADILSSFELSHDDANLQRLIFEASYAVVFAYDGARLVGCGRALSDGLRQAALYNIALEEAYHGKHWGRALIEKLEEQVSGCTVILYTHPKTVGYYEKLGFRRQKTGMVRFNQGPEKERWFAETGFMLPEGYRFKDSPCETTEPDRAE